MTLFRPDNPPPFFGTRRLHEFLKARGIPAARVERLAPVSRRQMARWKAGRSDIRLRQMIKILRAVRLIAGEKITMDEIFELEPENWPD